MMINKRLIGICSESKKYIALTVLTSWISIICNILIILMVGQFINKVYAVRGLLVNLEIDKLSTLLKFKVSENLSLAGTIAIIAVLLIIRYFSNIMYGKLSYLASASVRVNLRELIYKKLLKLGVGYNKVQSTSTIVQMTVEGVEALEIYFGRYLPQFFYSMLAPITLFVFISFISIKSAVVFIVCVPLIPLSIIAIMKIAKKILKEYWNSYANLGDTFLENLQGLTTLKVFDIDEERHRKMNEEAEGFRKITMKVLSMQLNSINIMDLIAFGGAALGTIVALIEFKNGNLSVGNLFVIILLSSEFFIPLRLLGSYFHIAMNGMAACDKIFYLLDAEEKEKDIFDDESSKLNNISVSLENVKFSYDGERTVVDNVNLDIPNKGLVAIVGESGSGKSTIASLIMNTNSVNDGAIKLNGINVENISLDDIYNKISLVSTNSYIFNGSIMDNLLMGKYDATKSEINDALKKARLYDFVQSLRDGLNTNVGEGGSSLSGGQKQRLALARAILGNREMIIFDEATSNIDIESEEAIWESIYELSKDKTILVISHRLANVVDADNIYVMKDGKIVENGNHDELTDIKGEYFSMVNKQNQLESTREVC
ncbi:MULTISPECIES: ABC transporter ATP-binding protein/permease [Clostridium]|uniref:ABC transporter ATP-binding protein/permease n=1 Tax=Clostridium TaxID=1485 RepID=UPI0002D1E1B2|nr:MULTISPECIES: ABC transporter ATP-binding protein/permease [Clostridium]AXB83601.1 ABC transporter ATP-binding protein/permease [Clostridium butyricum]ENZ30604.1 multidrug ABC transporter permease/ATP-binding protein [Clostridium butyricum 60E.3]MDU1340422.1 ABC transporter ATP-binding protein/permease [Clostridium butyricum]MDU4589896.1 ABC transporter ATP-binding protein/permease [Clostridium sp.]MZI82467.1 ATP-binding cassette domain-containing protein [Clostridium butyricum]